MATQNKTWERWSDEEVSAFWRFTRKASVEAAGSPSSIRREVVCGLPVNPKQKKKK